MSKKPTELYEILIIPKGQYSKPTKLLNKDKETYLHNLSVFKKAEKEGKVDVVFSGRVHDKDSFEQYRKAERSKMKKLV